MNRRQAMLRRRIVFFTILTLLFFTALLTIPRCSGKTVPVFQPEPDLTASAKVTMAGDFLIHSTSLGRAAKTNNGYDFAQFFSQDIKNNIDGDLNIANFEGPSDKDKAVSSYPTFNYPNQLIDDIKTLGINLFITANNHAYDKGFSGLVATRNALIEREVDFIGTYETQEQYDSECYIKDINGIKVGVVAYSGLDNGLSVGKSYAMRKFNEDDINDSQKIIEDVERLRASGAEVVITALHWGVEYQDKPTKQQIEYAEKLAEAGVDVIMGGHPHCVQPMQTITNEETGKKTIVYYSLGNFFADQSSLKKPKTQYGILGVLDIERDKAGVVTITPSYIPTTLYKPNGKYVLTTAKTGDSAPLKNAREHVEKVMDLME